MASGLVIRARKFKSNPLLDRKQFVLDVFHKESTKDFSRANVCAAVATKFRVSVEQVVTFGTKTKFGGGRSTCFCLIYNSMDSLKKFEPKHRLLRAKLIEPKKVKNRRTKKEEKNRCKNLRGKDKVNGVKAKKR